MLCAVDSIRFCNNLIVNQTFSYEKVGEEYIHNVISFVFHNVISFVLSLLQKRLWLLASNMPPTGGLSIAWYLAASCSINTTAGDGISHGERRESENVLLLAVWEL